MLAQRGTLEPLEAAGLVEQVLAGLGHAHAHGVQHLALGPHEVVLGRDGRWKVLARGSAAAARAVPPPEQARGEAAGPPADLYAAGAILALALTGTAPDTSPPALPGVPPPIANVVTRALDPDLRRRYQSAQEMESDLRAAAAPPPPPPRRASRSSSRRLRRHRRRASGHRRGPGSRRCSCSRSRPWRWPGG